MTTIEDTQNKIPKWFWFLTVIFLLWNIMGVLSFYWHTFITDEALSKLPENERALYGDYPLWTTIVFAIAVFGGLIGSLGLLLRRKWAKTFFILSFIAIIPQMIHNVFFTKSVDVYGLIQAITMPIFVVIIGGLLIWFSIFSTKKNWLK